MFPFLTKAKEVFLDILFPPICINCNKSLNDARKLALLCETCRADIVVNTALTCPVCRSRLAENKKICHQNNPYRLAAAASYESELVKNLIHKLKYQKISGAAKPLSEILARHLDFLKPKLNIAGFTSIPIPLHPQRKRERGFNQSELIAENLSAQTGLPIIRNALIRVKATAPQAELKDYAAREANLAESFRVKFPELIKNKNLILIDDVFTSGATMGAAVKTLKESGAGKIIALVVAKAG